MWNIHDELGKYIRRGRLIHYKDSVLLKR
jgi:hypothetical protein